MFRVAGAVHRACWRSCFARGRRLPGGWRSCGRRNTQGLLEALLRAWSPAGPRLAFVWQAHYTQPSGGAAARGWLSCGKSCCARGRRLASIHRAFWRRCCARGRRLARGWLSCGRRSTHSLLEELLRAWSPPGRRLAFVWQAQYTVAFWRRCCARGPPAGPRLAFVWQAQYTEQLLRAWFAAGPRLAFVSLPEELLRAWLPAGPRWLSCGRRSTHSLLEELLRAAGFRVWQELLRAWSPPGQHTQGLLEALLRAWSPAGPRLAFVWQAQYPGPAGGAAARMAAAGCHMACAVHRASWRSWCGRGRCWPAAGCRVAGAVHRASRRSCCHTTLSHHFVHTHTIFHTSSFTPCCHTHHLSHAIIDTPSFTHHVVRL